MEYPSLFKLNYTDFSNNTYQHFHLESLQPIQLSLWKNVFSTDVSNQTHINHNNITLLYAGINKALKGTFYYSGKSFSSQKLVLGTIFQYYIQYLAYNMFNNSQLVQPFNNLHTVQNSINDNIENIIHEILNNTADINIKSIIDNSQQQKFIHLKIFINKPNIPSLPAINVKNTCWHLHILLV